MDMKIDTTIKVSIPRNTLLSRNRRNKCMARQRAMKQLQQDEKLLKIKVYYLFYNVLMTSIVSYLKN